MLPLLNYKEGFLRLTFVLSLCVGLVSSLVTIIEEGRVKPFIFVGFAFGMGLVWFLYFFIRYVFIYAVKYIIRGFRDIPQIADREAILSSLREAVQIAREAYRMGNKDVVEREKKRIKELAIKVRSLDADTRFKDELIKYINKL